MSPLLEGIWISSSYLPRKCLTLLLYWAWCFAFHLWMFSLHQWILRVLIEGNSYERWATWLENQFQTTLIFLCVIMPLFNETTSQGRVRKPLFRMSYNLIMGTLSLQSYRGWILAELNQVPSSLPQCLNPWANGQRDTNSPSPAQACTWLNRFFSPHETLWWIGFASVRYFRAREFALRSGSLYFAKTVLYNSKPR